MPQSPAYRLGANYELLVSPGGAATALNISAPTVIAPFGKIVGRICRVSVLVAGTTTGKINDCATTSAVAAANEIAVIPQAVGVYEIDMPIGSGSMVITPGAGQTVSISYL